MARTVQLDWSKACTWGDFPPAATGVGVYQLTREWGDWYQLLYVGIVWSDTRDFNKRMQEHRKAWLSEKRGIRYRFATIRPLRGYTCTRELVEEIEGALIGELQPAKNKSKKSYYTSRHTLTIQSFGDRGFVPRIIDTATHIVL